MTISQMFDLAVKHRRAGDRGKTERLYRQILQRYAADAGAAHLQGSIERPDPASEQFRLALAQEPGSVKSVSSLSKILNGLDKPDHAKALLHQWADHWTAVARNCRECVDRSGEMQSLVRALQLEPRHSTAQTGLSGLLLQFASLDEAESLLFETLRDMRAPPGTLGLMGNVLKELGYVNLALECYSRGLDVKPTPAAGSNFVYALLYDPCQDDQEVAEQHREWARAFARRHYPASPKFINDPDTTRTLRVGYVSGHFNNHAVALFSLAMLQSHRRDQVEIFCYDNTSAENHDDYTKAFQASASHWRDITKLDDDQAADVIRDDAVDILVDLSGHIAGNRLLLLARRPAPVQVTYLGYQATTGMAVMDYRLTDAIADPPDQTDGLYVEQLVRLEPSFFVYQPSSDAPLVSPLPAGVNGFVTFGCLNNATKFSLAAVAAWAELLRRMPTARLLLLGPTANDGDPRVERMFAAQGIERERVRIVGKRPRGAYLDLYAEIDIALDPFPFSGHTTTCDALWQGVPVVTLAGRTYAGRMSASTLHQANLARLIANSPEEYLHIAFSLASNCQALGEIRATMRQRLADAPMLDARGFVRSLESAYRRMWHQWCDKQVNADRHGG